MTKNYKIPYEIAKKLDFSPKYLCVFLALKQKKQWNTLDSKLINELAEDCKCDPKTVKNHIRILIGHNFLGVHEDQIICRSWRELRQMKGVENKSKSWIKFDTIEVKKFLVEYRSKIVIKVIKGFDFILKPSAAQKIRSNDKMNKAKKAALDQFIECVGYAGLSNNTWGRKFNITPQRFSQIKKHLVGVKFKPVWKSEEDAMRQLSRPRFEYDHTSATRIFHKKGKVRLWDETIILKTTANRVNSFLKTHGKKLS